MSWSTIQKRATSIPLLAVSVRSVSAIRHVGRASAEAARVHYLWLPHRGRIYLMFVYGKNEASTLTAGQKKTLRAVVAQIKATDSPKE